MISAVVGIYSYIKVYQNDQLLTSTLNMQFMNDAFVFNICLALITNLFVCI